MAVIGQISLLFKPCDEAEGSPRVREGLAMIMELPGAIKLFTSKI
jgi:hypothetical protein